MDPMAFKKKQTKFHHRDNIEQLDTVDQTVHHQEIPKRLRGERAENNQDILETTTYSFHLKKHMGLSDPFKSQDLK